ncbi:MAG: hypothetical protein FNT29_06535 [Halothiobacillaceae bacterium]|nr:MAG: hypothetical protein FNT29_06535 [Halothiobacillaceae bacterium]
MQKPSHFLVSVMIDGQKHNLAYERLMHQSVPSWSIVRPPLGHAQNAEMFVQPALVRDVFQAVLRGVVRQDPPYHRKGLDADSLVIEGVFTEYRAMDPSRLESDEDRKARVLAQLACGERLARPDADFIHKLLG